MKQNLTEKLRASLGKESTGCRGVVLNTEIFVIDAAYKVIVI